MKNRINLSGSNMIFLIIKEFYHVDIHIAIRQRKKSQYIGCFPEAVKYYEYLQYRIVLMDRMNKNEAFSSMFRSFDRRVYYTALRYLRNRDEAADITQEVFYRAWKNIDSIDPQRPVFPWLYRITKNLCINRVKRKSGSEAGLEFPELEPGKESVENDLMRSESRDEVNRALAALPENFREIIILKHYDECSYEEMAEILDIPKGTVMSRLFNARKMLKEKLEVIHEM
jgi:RNA polymerase sigma-70 factor (ECF subfamily)